MSKGKWFLGIADVHVGSVFALVPGGGRPATDPMKDEQGKVTKLEQFRYDAHRYISELQSLYWIEFKKLLKRMPKMDYCFILGDCIEGKQHKSGGAHLITSDISEQIDMSVSVIDTICHAVGYPKTWGVRGTPYHVTDMGGSEAEDMIYCRLRNMQGYDDSLTVEANGVIWNLQHHISRSSTPYGKQSPLAKQIVQNTLAAAMEKEEDADMILRAHTHYCVSAGFPMSNKRAYTLPTLKLRGEAYGRQYNDLYDVGMLAWYQPGKGEPLQEHRFKIDIAYRKPTLYKG
jgi:hypothetical protein